MSKQWPIRPYDYLMPSIKEFQKFQERKLDDRDGWRPTTPPVPEIGGERAIVPEYDSKFPS
jgi:hypothetical protein